MEHYGILFIKRGKLVWGVSRTMEKGGGCLPNYAVVTKDFNRVCYVVASVSMLSSGKIKHGPQDAGDFSLCSRVAVHTVIDATCCSGHISLSSVWYESRGLSLC